MGLDPATLPGIVIDDKQAKKSHRWRISIGLEGFVGTNYLYARSYDDATIRFEAKAPKSARYEIRIAYQPHPNRGNHVPVTIEAGEKTRTVKVNMKKPPAKDDSSRSVSLT